MRSKELRKAAEEARKDQQSKKQDPWALSASTSFADAIWQKPSRSLPTTDADVQAHIDDWRETFQSAWPEHLDNLVSVSGAGLEITVINEASSYLKQPRLDLRFPDCRAVEVEDRKRSSMTKVVPDIVPKAPASSLYGIALSDISPLRFRNYPVEWEQDEAGVTVTLTPDALRPGVPWRTPGPGVVLLARADADTVVFTWTATAVASRFRCKRAGLGSGFVGLMLRGGGDSVGLVGVVDGVSGS